MDRKWFNQRRLKITILERLYQKLINWNFYCFYFQSYTIRATTSKHIQTNLLGSKCRDLKRLNFTNSKSIAPNFYIKFMTKFPNLLVIDFQGTILDNESFNSIGETCIKLKELNASGTTITDTGLQYLTSSISSDATIKWVEVFMVKLLYINPWSQTLTQKDKDLGNDLELKYILGNIWEIFIIEQS